MSIFLKDQHIEEPAEYVHINQNEFVYRRHKKQKEEDIAICVCKLDPSDPDSACAERCLNVLTSTECTPTYCPCNLYCRNQRFQKCQYARTRLFKTDGRGWGLLADENIKAGQFIIEYCGEVISWKEAKRRSHIYETQGLKDAFIICLNAVESIDATKKGSLARFINHSCQPNCETRKWNVLGEIRVGIFAKHDIPAGSELSYDYNFEWYGGAKVRCLCGAPSCSGFLGAKSRRFQVFLMAWYSVENIPLYDSAEDEPTSKLQKIHDPMDLEYISNGKVEPSVQFNDYEQVISTASFVKPEDLVPVQDAVSPVVKAEINEEAVLYPQDSEKIFSQKNAMIVRIKSNSACRNYHIEPGPISKKRSQIILNGRPKHLPPNGNDAKLVAQRLPSKEAQELLKCEEMRDEASSQLDCLYNEIRPAIEEHERDSQDSVATSVAEKWIEASCAKLKAEFDLYSSLIKHVIFTPRKAELLDVDENHEQKTLEYDIPQNLSS
ncbi:hypothetical protein ACJRO7_024582 [Eucalyptus globulus]|uniref:Histone-lysine N-methyltransferase ASHH1 n=1 Tax=Eucalyptus globulus TaxID=34317 RepID=A0ABD3K843_EUCGL